MRIMREATEKEEKDSWWGEGEARRKGRITAGGGHPKQQKRLQPNGERGSKEKSWPAGQNTEASSP